MPVQYVRYDLPIKDDSHVGTVQYVPYHQYGFVLLSRSGIISNNISSNVTSTTTTAEAAAEAAATTTKTTAAEINR